MTRTEEFRKDILNNLENNILPFWISLKDPRGGYFPEVSGDGLTDPDAKRGVILNARIIWAFSAAYRFLNKREYLLAAAQAKDYFLEHFVDHKYGGVYWTVDKYGERADSKAQLYAQAFAIYGLSEFCRAKEDDQAMKCAVNLYKIVEKNFRDPVNGGYIEALSRDFKPLEDKSLSGHDINADKTMNSHLHLLEAYANLYRVWPDEGLKERVIELLDLICDRILGNNGHLNLYFKDNWTILPGANSYGHDIETSWLALESAFAIQDFDIVEKVRTSCKKMLKAALEGYQSDGSMIYEKLTDGTFDMSRQWWVQAETVVGSLWAWKYLGDDEGADRAMHTWDYISSHLIDHKGGEWYWACDADGNPDTASVKAGIWKCPYHNTRMCIEALKIFD